MRHPKKVIVTLLVILILIGLWASQVLPGNFLYQYKVNINNPIVKLFSFSRARKARYEVLLLGDRLSEITNLAKKGAVTDTAFHAWEQAFNQNYLIVENRINSFDTATDILVANELANDAHGILAGYVEVLSPSSNLEIHDAQKIIDVVNPALNRMENLIQDTINKTAQYIPKQQFLDTIDGQISDVIDYSGVTKNTLSTQEGYIEKSIYQKLLAMQMEIDKSISDAKDKRGKDFYADATLAIQSAHAQSLSLRIIVTTLTQH